jgi:ubiquinone/menaquinone biosynthesis C-methylase UbiE
MQDFTGNMERFTGFGSLYDKARPSPPAALAALLRTVSGSETLQTVVDLGSGTGLSTRYWAGHVGSVIGVEPTASMRHEAESHPLSNVRYVEGFSHDTGLPGGSADIVTCSQSLHWMEPEGTFREAARLLRPGGVFAANDFDWPPITPCWEVDAAYERCMTRGRQLEIEHGLETPLRRWDKAGHLARMAASGQFRYTREALLHHEDHGDATRLVNLFRSQGFVMTLLKQGLTESDLEIDKLTETAIRFFGENKVPWLWSLRVRYAIK